MVNDNCQCSCGKTSKQINTEFLEHEEQIAREAVVVIPMAISLFVGLVIVMYSIGLF